MTTEQPAMNEYLNGFRRRSRLIVGVFTVALGIAVAVAVLPPDTYKASALMSIDLEGTNAHLVEPTMLTNYADQYIKSLQQKVLSDDNLHKWLQESGAYAYESDKLTERELVKRLEENIKVELVYTSVVEEKTGKPVDLVTGFTINFTARDPKAAEILTNNVASAFLAEDRAVRVAKAATASSFLAEQIEAKRTELIAIETKIATFKEQNAGSLPSLMVLNMTALERTERELESVEREIRTLQQDRFFRDAQLKKITQSAGGAAARLADLETEYLRAIALYGPDHPDVIRIRRQVAALTNRPDDGDGSSEIAQLEAELAAAQERYSDEHPDVIRLKRRLEQLRSGGQMSDDRSAGDPLYLQLRAQINAIDANLAGLRTRAQELRTSKANLEDGLANMPQVERQYQDLERELQTATLAFDGLRKNLAQAQQIESFESGERGARLQLVNAAEAPESPTGPPRLAIAILGLFVAPSLAGGAALLAELTDNTIRGSKDIQMVLHTHAIATVPIVQNSVSRSLRRRQSVIVSVSALMLAALIILVISAVSA